MNHSGYHLGIHRISCFLLGLLLMLTTGCVSSLAGRPARSARPREILDQLKASPDTNVVALIKKYHDTTDAAERKQNRNRIIDLSMIQIDQQYTLFVEQFTTSKKTFDTVTDLGSVFASSASAAITPTTTKNVLSLVSGGFTASRTSVGKNFFYEQSIKAIIQQMTAERRAVALDLIKGTGSSTDEYPLAAALQDLERYYFAGTIDGAFAGMQKGAAQKEEQANREIESIRKELKGVIDYKALATTWITNNGETAARTKIKSWLGQQTEELKLLKAQTNLPAAAINSNLTPETIATVLPQDDRENAIAAIKADRSKKPRGSTFESKFTDRVDRDKVLDILPGQALANLLGAFAADDILELTKTPPTASK
jgi:hypothetical protein